MKILSRLVFRRFYDVILESRAPLGKQPIREHFARPLDGNIRREHPHIRRCPGQAGQCGRSAARSGATCRDRTC